MVWRLPPPPSSRLFLGRADTSRPHAYHAKPTLAFTVALFSWHPVSEWANLVSGHLGGMQHDHQRQVNHTPGILVLLPAENGGKGAPFHRRKKSNPHGSLNHVRPKGDDECCM